MVPIGDIQRKNKEYIDDCCKIKEEDEDLLRKIHALKIVRKENHERIEKAKLDRDNAKKNLEEMQIEQKRLQEQDAKINKETEMVLGEKVSSQIKSICFATVERALQLLVRMVRLFLFYFKG